MANEGYHVPLEEQILFDAVALTLTGIVTAFINK